MMEDTDCAVESNDEGDDEEGEGDYAEGFAPCETLVVSTNVREWVRTVGWEVVPIAIILDANCHVAALKSH
jgi:hypothetical protein